MTTATVNKVKAPKKGFKLDRQMIPTLAAVVIFILMIIMGQALFGTYIRLGFISSLFIDHAYLIILAVAMTLPILTGGIDLSVGAIVGSSTPDASWPASPAPQVRLLAPISPTSPMGKIGLATSGS